MVDREGCNLVDAAAAFGLTTAAVSLIMVQRHGAYRTPGIDVRAARKEQREVAQECVRSSIRESKISARESAVSRVKDGESIASISGDTGISYHAIWQWCREAGVSSRPVLLPSPRPGQVSRTSRALELVDAGLSRSEAARRVGMSPQALDRGIRRRNGERFS